MTDRKSAGSPQIVRGNIGADLGPGGRIDCNQAASYQWRSPLTEISEDSK
jgi:hypothetical protein